MQGIDHPPTDPNLAPATGEHPVDPVEGQRAWIAQLDRKLSTRSYAGGAALILALAAAIVAIVMAVDARDNSASKDELTQIRQELSALEELENRNEQLSTEVTDLGTRLDGVESQVGAASDADKGIEDRLGVVEDDIEDLREQISTLETDVDSAAADAAAADDDDTP